MVNDEKLERAIAKMNKMSITDLRQVARELGINRPAVGKKERLITEIIALAKGELMPVPLSTRGAPPKSTNFDKELYTEIMEYRQSMLDGNSDMTYVCDGNPATASAGVYVGIVEMSGGYCYLHDLPSGKRVCVHEYIVNKFNLRSGDRVKANCVLNEGGQTEVSDVISVNGEAFGRIGNRRNFGQFSRVYADTPLKTDYGAGCTALRMTDFFAPIALGQRVLALTDGRAAATYIARNLILNLTKNADAEVVGAFVGCTPEDRVSLTREIKSDGLFFAGFDEDLYDKLKTVSLATEHCKRLVEFGRDVILVIDGFFRPAKRFNEVVEHSSDALKKILACAGKMEEGGSLTVIAISDNNPDNVADRALISEFADFQNVFLKYTALKGEIILDYRASHSDFVGRFAEAAGNLRLKLSDEVLKIFTDCADNCAIAQTYKD